MFTVTGELVLMTLPADPTVLKITLPNVLGSCSPREGGSEACGGLVVEASATASDPRSCAWLRFPPPCLPVAQQSWVEAVPDPPGHQPTPSQG